MVRLAASKRGRHRKRDENKSRRYRPAATRAVSSFETHDVNRRSKVDHQIQRDQWVATPIGTLDPRRFTPLVTPRSGAAACHISLSEKSRVSRLAWPRSAEKLRATLGCRPAVTATGSDPGDAQGRSCDGRRFSAKPVHQCLAVEIPIHRVESAPLVQAFR
jgi:hypothetical protein